MVDGGLPARFDQTCFDPLKNPIDPVDGTLSTDAIVILKEDYQQIRKLFRDFAGAGENATSYQGQRDAHHRGADRPQHLENAVTYPEVRKCIPELEGEVLASYEETMWPTFCEWSCTP